MHDYKAPDEPTILGKVSDASFMPAPLPEALKSPPEPQEARVATPPSEPLLGEPADASMVDAVLAMHQAQLEQASNWEQQYSH